MILSKVASLINVAVYGNPPPLIADLCKEYYQPYYYLFYLLAKEITSGYAVELGVSKGLGVNSLALGNSDLRVVGLDHNVSPEHQAPNVEFHFQSALPVPEFITPEISVLHVDTEHSYTNALNEFMQYKPYLLPGAVVCFDDLHAKDDEVLKAFYELPHTKIQCDKLHPVNGYGVLIYE